MATEYQTKVKLFIKDAATEWIVGAVVCLYDRDRVSRDDYLGTDSTNAYGEATFRFTSDEFLDMDDRMGGSLPELYVKVFDTQGRCVVSTRAQASRNIVPSVIQVPIERGLALQHGLIRA